MAHPRGAAGSARIVEALGINSGRAKSVFWEGLAPERGRALRGSRNQSTAGMTSLVGTMKHVSTPSRKI
eukprot:2838848-Prymnesium_polylepis.1